MSRSQPNLKITIEKPPNPNILYSNNTEEFNRIIAREKAGEFRIYTMARGKTNGAWIFSVGYKK